MYYMSYNIELYCLICPYLLQPCKGSYEICKLRNIFAEEFRTDSNSKQFINNTERSKNLSC